jgi:hypothetical protein
MLPVVNGHLDFFGVIEKLSLAAQKFLKSY